ncbi:MAG: protease modulator HflK N-terminal domain-containing protein, partial [Pseudomonadota bacterium]
MPWSTKGGGGSGGPWGPSDGNGQGPWGGGGGGGPTPPDFEDMIRRGQDRVRQAMPGGVGGGRGILIVIGIALILWLATGIFRVQPDEQGVVMRFGQYVR